MKVLAIVGGLAIISSSCATRNVALYFEKPAIGKRTPQQYKDPIEEHLFDPDSSRYRNVKYYNPKLKGKKITVMCGKHNAKNRMGGYTGYKRFVSDGVRSSSDTYTDQRGHQKSVEVDCLCRNGEISLKCQKHSDSGASVGAHCWSWLFFPYGGGWWWLKCY